MVLLFASIRFAAGEINWSSKRCEMNYPQQAAGYQTVATSNSLNILIEGPDSLAWIPDRGIRE